MIAVVEELRGRWWNRSYGRMARKDLWLWQDGPLWTVGARHGDADGGVWRKSFDRESGARALVDRMMERNGGRKAWLDMTSLAHDSPRRGRAANQPAEHGDETMGGRRSTPVDHEHEDWPPA
jgi:hypothetical protein